MQDDEEFQHFQDEDEFEGFDVKEKAIKGKGQEKSPVLKISTVSTFSIAEWRLKTELNN